jgi:hypothetical protein
MKEYLGDAVYVEDTNYGIRLTTEDGISVTNEIHLEPQVIMQLIKYLELKVKYD